MNMKACLVVMVAALCVTSVMAQGRRGRAKAGGGDMPKGQVIKISEITKMGGENDYLAEAPQVEAKWKLKINHKDTYKKDSAKGWHFFEVAYHVGNVGTDSSGAKKPILNLPEVEITYALLYDMKKSKIASSVYNNAKKAGGAIGWDDPKQMNILLTETYTYTDITPGREHYAAVCVPPSFVAIAGQPVMFSVQIKVDGELQGEIATEVAGGAKVGDKEVAGLVAGKKGEDAAWWERIQNLSDAVTKREGILRDRSMSPFSLVGDQYYDQVKSK